MQIYDRQEDLTKVFDKTWKANHNDDVKIAREKEKNFMDRMFNVKREVQSPDNNGFKPMTEQEKLQNRQSNMAGMHDFNTQTKLNNIRGKFN